MKPSETPEQRRIYYQRNREKILLQNKKYRDQNPEKFKQRSKRYRFGPARERLLAAKREYGRKHKAEISAYRKANNTPERRAAKAAYDREYRKRNRARIEARIKEWNKNNRVRMNAYHREKRKTDPQYRLKNNLRCRMNTALRNVGLKRDYPLEKLLGCTVVQLMAHLESQFQRGMSWNNRKQWDVDHIIPCAKFDLTDREQQLRCFHFSNLRPMWKLQNVEKGDRIVPCQPELPLAIHQSVKPVK